MVDRLLLAATEYDRGDPKRIQHLIKVYQLAGLIARSEKVTDTELRTVEAAAILHDIGIHEGERLYGRNDGKIQEQLGPDIADRLLEQVGGYGDIRGRVLYLIAHHHTYTDIDGIDLQILIEADFLVNLYEDDSGESAVKAAGEKIFKTQTGKMLLKTMYGI